MPEAIRLVIWDLDETFWKGTLTEGGIREYVQAHHDIVIELARRGIMSSICSKNELAEVKRILETKGLWDYFIFPSISWATKGDRIAEIVETAQLRPETILFVDDNPNNLAEAKAIVPDLQVADQHAIADFLASPLFAGKDDRELTRLKQYKLLEQKAEHSAQHSGSNEDFLRSCNIRVQIDYDVEANIDRAIELINRTNQLNYTKYRLSEDPQIARDALRELMRPFDRQAALVRVVDNYGDYGYVGFFMTGGQRASKIAGAANLHLIHYCFSCRTLGMLVEQWLYEYLGRPELKVAGEVVTDLSAPRKIDWVRLSDSAGASVLSKPKLGGPAVVYGGCEAEIISLYVKRNFDSVKVFGNFAANGMVYQINSARALLDMGDRDPNFCRPEAAKLGFPMHLACDDIFAPAAEGTTYFVHLMMDALRIPMFKHKKNRWNVLFDGPLKWGFKFGNISEVDLIHLLETRKAEFGPDLAAHILSLARHLGANYSFGPPSTVAQVMTHTREVIERVPLGGRIMFVVDHDLLVLNPTEPFSRDTKHPQLVKYLRELSALVRNYPYSGLVSMSEVLSGPEDLVENHYARRVFLRLGDLLVERASRLPPRLSPPAPRAARATPKAAAPVAQPLPSKPPSPGGRPESPGLRKPLDAMADAETVEELFKLILGRPINDNAFKAGHHNANDIRYWVKRLIDSDEFMMRYLKRVGVQVRTTESARG